jgi:septal ring factor EnvC (AmiA/AmiB activator)
LTEISKLEAERNELALTNAVLEQSLKDSRKDLEKCQKDLEKCLEDKESLP